MFEASFLYIASSRPATVTERPCLKEEEKEEERQTDMLSVSARLVRGSGTTAVKTGNICPQETGVLTETDRTPSVRRRQ